MKKKSTKTKPYQEVKEPQSEYFSFKESDVHALASKILKAIGEDTQKKALLLGLLVSDVATKQEYTVLLNELKAMREASDKRFEAIDKRFEAIDKRFEEQRQDFKMSLQAMDQSIRADMDKRFEEQRQDFQHAIETLNKSLSSKIDTLGSRWGIMAENTFTNALKEVLGQAGFQVSKWRRTDTNGEFFIRPRDAEIDILIRDGKLIAIEVKSSVDIGDVEIFERTIRFYEKSESAKVDKKIIVGIYKYNKVNEYAKELGIKIVSEIDDVVQGEQGES